MSVCTDGAVWNDGKTSFSVAGATRVLQYILDET